MTNQEVIPEINPTEEDRYQEWLRREKENLQERKNKAFPAAEKMVEAFGKLFRFNPDEREKRVEVVKDFLLGAAIVWQNGVTYNNLFNLCRGVWEQELDRPAAIPINDRLFLPCPGEAREDFIYFSEVYRYARKDLLSRKPGLLTGMVDWTRRRLVERPLIGDGDLRNFYDVTSSIVTIIDLLGAGMELSAIRTALNKL